MKTTANNPLGKRNLVVLTMVGAALIWSLPVAFAATGNQATSPSKPAAPNQSVALAGPSNQSNQLTIEGAIQAIQFSNNVDDPQMIKVNDTVIQLPKGANKNGLEFGAGVRVTGQKQGDILMATTVTLLAPPPPVNLEPGNDNNDNGNSGDNADDNDNNDNGNNGDNGDNNGDNGDNGDDNDNN